MIITLEQIKATKELNKQREEIANRLEVAMNMSGAELEELYREYYSK